MTPSEIVDDSLWTDAGVVRGIAVVAVALLVMTVILYRRRRRSGRAAAIICLSLSVALHSLLLVYVPEWQLFQTGGGSEVDPDRSTGVDPVAVAVLESQLFDSVSDAEVTSTTPGSGSLLAPLPVGEPWKESRELPDPTPRDPAEPAPAPRADPTPDATPDSADVPAETAQPPSSHPPPSPPPSPQPGVEPWPMSADVPASLAAAKRISNADDPSAPPQQTPVPPAPMTSLESELGEWMQATLAELQPSPVEAEEGISTPLANGSEAAPTRESADETPPRNIARLDSTPRADLTPRADSSARADTTERADSSADAPAPAATARQEAAAVPSAEASGSGGTDLNSDFVARRGAAKRQALQQTGGDAETEQAVAAALRFLVANQRADGGWNPAATGGGIERSPLGLHRGNAGRRAETAITGLALLSLLGAGHTHQSGEYRESVYNGLAFLISRQKPDGSLAGSASVYAAHYSHAMATLAMAEAAAMTADASALESTRRAIAYTRSMQHPVTGGWRYTRGDPGDLSQLGWHVMSVDAAVRSGAVEQADARRVFRGAKRFLDSVRTGRSGGQACYRPGERPTVTMTAEALASRLMMGDRPGEAAIGEAERIILQNLPPRGDTVAVDNYYYWYYATVALHQLQDDAWATWNETLKERLLATQRPDGSWPTTSLWGGYGGTVYTTSMATLCLEAYYRHGLRQ